MGNAQGAAAGPVDRPNAVPYPQPELFIAGEWLAGEGTGSPVVNPATGETIAICPHASLAQLDAVLAAAASAAPVWKGTSALDRGRILRDAAGLLRDRIDALASITTLEQGKPLAEARAEWLNAAEFLEWYAEEGRRAYGRIIPSRGPGSRLDVMVEPIGPVAAFAPWNFPAAMPARKIAASLAAGCPCIIKPAEETPGSALGIARALQDAGLPGGVLNVVFGVPSEVSSHLVASPVIRKISLTGSTAVGRELGALAARHSKPATMELGGHAPVLVFEDADLEKAAAALVAAKFRNAGQVCTSPTRFFVHEAVYERFVDLLAKQVAALQLGPGLKPDTQMGPLANNRRVAAIASLVADAVACGATKIVGAEPQGEGFFHSPTLLVDVPDGAAIMHEEPFGPVVAIQRFGSLDEAIERANALPYGLAAYVFTQSLRYANAAAERLRCGMVGVNTLALNFPETPFGGTGDSGHGREGGSEGLQSYLSTKFVNQQWG